MGMCEVCCGDEKNVVESDGGDGCMTLSMCLKPLTCML